MEKKKQSDYFNYEMISEEEKQNILKDLDMEFSSHFKAPENGSRYKSFSSGLTLPAMVALIALILGIVTILISDRFLIRSRPAVISTSRDWNSESEWAVLKAYHTKVQEAVKHAIIEKKEYQEEKALWTKGESPLLEELKTLTEDLEYEYYTENYTSAEEKLRQKIKSVPELAAAFNILQKIESERNNTTREEASALPPVAATPRKTETPPPRQYYKH